MLKRIGNVFLGSFLLLAACVCLWTLTTGTYADFTGEVVMPTFAADAPWTKASAPVALFLGSIWFLWYGGPLVFRGLTGKELLDD